MEDKDLTQFDLSKKKKRVEKSHPVHQPHEDPVGEDDYEYVDLLDRFYTVQRENHPSLVSRKKLPVPRVTGSKKTVLINFTELMQITNCSPEHIQSYTETSLHLVIKGRLRRDRSSRDSTCNLCKSSRSVK